MSEIVPFMFESQPVRAVTRDGDPWFIAADVCHILEIGNVTMALSRLDDDERTLISIEGGPPAGTNLVSESGLYSLVLGSRKREARNFKRWIVREVIPQIRRTGSYSIASAPALPDLRNTETVALILAESLRVVQEEREKRTEVEAQLAEAAPKAAFADTVLDCGDTLGFRQACQQIRAQTGANENEVRGLMRKRGWIQRLGGDLAPAHVGVERGYVTTRERPYVAKDGTSHARPELRITQHGLKRAIELLLSTEAA